ncbi:MAG: hypothetical protein AAF546_00075 [Verrucomicrobiota bacterium]
MTKDRITKGISFPDEKVLRAAQERSQSLGLKSFSEYVNQLIRKDNGLPNIFEAESGAETYQVQYPAQEEELAAAEDPAPYGAKQKTGGEILQELEDAAAPFRQAASPSKSRKASRKKA